MHNSNELVNRSVFETDDVIFHHKNRNWIWQSCIFHLTSYRYLDTKSISHHSKALIHIHVVHLFILICKHFIWNCNVIIKNCMRNIYFFFNRKKEGILGMNLKKEFHQVKKSLNFLFSFQMFNIYISESYYL